MTHQIQPITITSEDIATVAEKIASESSNSSEYSEAEWQRATHAWLRRNIRYLISEPSFWAEGQGWDKLPCTFSFEIFCDVAGCFHEPLPNSNLCQYHRECANEEAAQPA